MRRGRPDLFITDIKIPKMDGYEFLDRLRREPRDAATPVIFYTALSHEREARIVAEFHGVADINTNSMVGAFLSPKIAAKVKSAVLLV